MIKWQVLEFCGNFEIEFNKIDWENYELLQNKQYFKKKKLVKIFVRCFVRFSDFKFALARLDSKFWKGAHVKTMRVY